MSTTPWAALTVAIRKLADKVDAMPVVREATLVNDDAVRFDIDTQDTLLHGNLAKGMPPGTRVLTLTLRHYVWVLGGRNRPPRNIIKAGEVSIGGSTENFPSVGDNMAFVVDLPVGVFTTPPTVMVTDRGTFGRANSSVDSVTADSFRIVTSRVGGGWGNGTVAWLAVQVNE